METRAFGQTGLNASQLGLGCSRLGSILGASRTEAIALLRTAAELGITYFDTSDLYGQGDSERMIGATLAGQPNIVIATKIGKRHPFKVRLLAPLKAPLSRLLKSAASSVVRQQRSNPVPTCFAPAYLSNALHRSLKRLGVETIDVVMLHSPATAILRAGDAMDVIERARTAGKIRVIGVSVDDVEAARAALADPRVRALQLPLRPGEQHFAPIVADARARGVAIVAREILGGPGLKAHDAVGSAIRFACATPGVNVALVGTTRIEHLREALAALQKPSPSAQRGPA